MAVEHMGSGRRALLSNGPQMSPEKVNEAKDMISEVYREVKEPACLENLPGELLKRIFVHLSPDPDSSLNQHRMFTQNANNSRDVLRSLTHVSKTISPWAQEVLFTSPFISAKLQYDWKTGLVHDSPSQCPIQCPITLLARTLLEERDMGRKIKQLTFVLPQKGGYGSNDKTCDLVIHDLDVGRPAIAVIQQAEDFIKTLPLPRSLRDSWSHKLISQYPYTLLGVIFALAPKVKQIGIVMNETRVKDGVVDFLTESFGIRATGATKLAHIRAAGIFDSLKTLEVSGLHPIRLTGLEMFPQIQDLLVRSKFQHMQAANIIRIITPERQFENVSRLHLDVQVGYVSGRRMAQPIEHYGPLLAKFLNLRHLDLKDMYDTYPIINRYPMVIGDLLKYLTNPDKLVSLKLPEAFRASNSLPEAMVRLSNLQELSAPFSEIVNDVGDMFQALPETLRYLEVYQASLDTINCLHVLLQEKVDGGNWESLACVQLNFAACFSRNSLKLFESQVMFTALWDNARETNVELISKKCC